jgi:hypothetical protein
MFPINAAPGDLRRVIWEIALTIYLAVKVFLVLLEN